MTDNKKKTQTTKKKGSGTAGKVGAFAAGAAIATAAVGYFLYGPNGAQNRKKIEGWTIKAKGEVLSKLEALKEVSEEKYHQIVDTVTDRYAKMKDVGEDKAETLNRELKRYWSKIKRETKETAGDAKEKSDSIRKKVARRIAPKGDE
jgi:gas vesicle protein